MKPINFKLLKYAIDYRNSLLQNVIIILCKTLSTIFAAYMLCLIIVGAFENGIAKIDTNHIIFFLLFSFVRAFSIWLLERQNSKYASKIKASLRIKAVNSIYRGLSTQNLKLETAKTVNAITAGLDALDNYFLSYIPQLVATAISTPILVFIILFHDSISFLIIIIVFPIIPFFMVLIGMATKSVQEKQWKEYGKLSEKFYDLIQGLTTLKIYGRDRIQSKNIIETTLEYQKSTMRVLRVTFLSGFVLDLAATISVALVAVTIGVRLINGNIYLFSGLLVLLIIPEVFIPIRQVGASFHASAEGMVAIEDVIKIIQSGEKTLNTQNKFLIEEIKTNQISSGIKLEIKNLSLSYGDNKIIDNLNINFLPNCINVISGSSGLGKSTLLELISGHSTPNSGAILLQNNDLLKQNIGERRDISWSGQNPGLIKGSVLAQIILGDKNWYHAIDNANSNKISFEQRNYASRLLNDLGLFPDVKLDTMINELGSGVSGGQAQRISIARALYRLEKLKSKVLLLDEPSSALDIYSEKNLIEFLKNYVSPQIIIIIVSHRMIVIDKGKNDYLNEINLDKNNSFIANRI